MLATAETNISCSVCVVCVCVRSLADGWGVLITKEGLGGEGGW